MGLVAALAYKSGMKRELGTHYARPQSPLKTLLVVISAPEIPARVAMALPFVCPSYAGSQEMLGARGTGITVHLCVANCGAPIADASGPKNLGLSISYSKPSLIRINWGGYVIRINEAKDSPTGQKNLKIN
jgi:hypothetical protein